MAFTHWESLKKIDAHIHILPDAVHKANPDSDDVWLCTDIHGYCAMMDDLHIEKAVIMPLNDPWLMSMEFTIDAVHRNLRDMKNASPGRFYAFADIDTRNTPAHLRRRSEKHWTATVWTASRSTPIIRGARWMTSITPPFSRWRSSGTFPSPSIPIPIPQRMSALQCALEEFWNAIPACG